MSETLCFELTGPNEFPTNSVLSGPSHTTWAQTPVERLFGCGLQKGDGLACGVGIVTYFRAPASPLQWRWWPGGARVRRGKHIGSFVVSGVPGRESRNDIGQLARRNAAGTGLERGRAQRLASTEPLKKGPLLPTTRHVSRKLQSHPYGSTQDARAQLQQLREKEWGREERKKERKKEGMREFLMKLWRDEVSHYLGVYHKAGVHVQTYDYTSYTHGKQ